MMQKKFRKWMCAICLGVFVPAVIYPAEMRVTRIEGEAFTLQAGTDEWIPLGENFPLEENDEVRTGEDSRIELASPEGNLVELVADSLLVVEGLSDKITSFFLSWGGLVAKVVKRKERRFSVRTPVATLAVRGTEFAVDMGEEEEDFEVGVLEGSVAVGREGMEEILLSPGEGWLFRRGQAPRKIKDLPPRIKARLVARIKFLRKRHPLVLKKWKNISPKKRLKIRKKILKKWKKASPERKEKIKSRFRKDLKKRPRQKIRDLRQRRRGRRRR